MGEAGLKGFVAGGLSGLGSAVAAAYGGGLAAQALAQGGAAAATYAVNSSIHEAFHHGEAPASFSGWSLLTATAGGAATPVLGGFFSRLAQRGTQSRDGMGLASKRSLLGCVLSRTGHGPGTSGDPGFVWFTAAQLAQA